MYRHIYPREKTCMQIYSVQFSFYKLEVNSYEHIVREQDSLAPKTISPLRVGPSEEGQQSRGERQTQHGVAGGPLGGKVHLLKAEVKYETKAIYLITQSFEIVYLQAIFIENVYERKQGLYICWYWLLNMSLNGSI